jgi:hypothetical protein
LVVTQGTAEVDITSFSIAKAPMLLSSSSSR